MNTIDENQISNKMKKYFQPKIRRLIEGTSGEDSKEFFCLNMIEGVCSQKISDQSHYNLSFLFSYSKAKESEKEKFFTCVLILAHGSVNAIRQKFHYYDEQVGFFRDLSVSSVYECRSEKIFTDPESGDEISEFDFNEKVFPYYCVTDELIKVYGEAL